MRFSLEVEVPRRSSRRTFEPQLSLLQTNINVSLKVLSPNTTAPLSC